MSKGKRKKAIIFMSVGVVVLAALFAGVSMYHMSVQDSGIECTGIAFAGAGIYSSQEERLERQLMAANAYLEETDYVQAVTEFAKAIRIDPENVESYLGMEAAYEGMDDIHMAVQALDRGYMATGDDRFLEEKQKFLIEWEDEEFEAVVRQYLEKPEGDIYLDEISMIKKINIVGKTIALYGEGGLLAEESFQEIPCSFNDLQYFVALTELGVYDINICDISWLGNLTNLVRLALDFNDISDISALSKLTDLTSLGLGNNNIRDISVLSKLTNLTSLSLGSNNISDISVLSELTDLTSLNLYDNNISDVSVLSKLTNLTSLSLGDNTIRDISALSKLTSLTYLELHNANISDISVLSTLTDLKYLYLESNTIRDISILGKLTNLTELGLNNNNISDISALSTLTNLTYLNLYNNNISDISALSNLKKLTYLYLRNNNISDYTSVSFVPYVWR